MSPRGLVVSAAGKNDRSAYTHRIMKLAECLEQRSIRCDFFHLPNNPPLNKVTTACLFFPFWLRTLRQYDFIHCGDHEAGQTLFFCSPILRSAIVLDIHGDGVAQSALSNEIQSSGRNRSASLRVKLEDWLATTCCHHMLTVSTPQMKALMAAGHPREKISLIRNGVDLELFRYLPQPADPPYTFGYIGEFQSWQGIDNLIQAFELYDDPRHRLLIVGFQKSDREIKRMFSEKFGARVELVDRTDRNTLVELVKSVGILIIPRIAHPAIKHAFPTKFAEYAAMGRPIMVNDVDETADFVTEYGCGFVAEPSPESMAQVMKRAAETPSSALEEMGRRARSMAQENFSWEKIGNAYAEVIFRLTSGSSGRNGK